MNIDRHPIWTGRYSKTGLWATLQSDRLASAWLVSYRGLTNALMSGNTSIMFKDVDWQYLPRHIDAIHALIKLAYHNAGEKYREPKRVPDMGMREFVYAIQEMMENLFQLLDRDRINSYKEMQRMLERDPRRARQHMERWVKVMTEIAQLYHVAKRLQSEMARIHTASYEYNPTLDRMLLAMRIRSTKAQFIEDLKAITADDAYVTDAEALTTLQERARIIELGYDPAGEWDMIAHIWHQTQFGKRYLTGLVAVQNMFKNMDPKYLYKFDPTSESCVFHMYLMKDANEIGGQLTRADVMGMEYVADPNDPTNWANMPQICFLRNTGNKLAQHHKVLKHLPKPGTTHDNRGVLDVPVLAGAEEMMAKRKKQVETLLQDIKSEIKSCTDKERAKLKKKRTKLKAELKFLTKELSSKTRSRKGIKAGESRKSKIRRKIAKVKQRDKDANVDLKDLAARMTRVEATLLRPAALGNGYYLIAVCAKRDAEDGLLIRAMRAPANSDLRVLSNLGGASVWFFKSRSPHWARRLPPWSGKDLFAPYRPLTEGELESIRKQSLGWIAKEDIKTSDDTTHTAGWHAPSDFRLPADDLSPTVHAALLPPRRAAAMLVRAGARRAFVFHSRPNPS